MANSLPAQSDIAPVASNLLEKGGMIKGEVAMEDGLDGTLQCFSVPYFDLTVIALDRMTWAVLFLAPITEESSMLVKLFILYISSLAAHLVQTLVAYYECHYASL